MIERHDFTDYRLLRPPLHIEDISCEAVGIGRVCVLLDMIGGGQLHATS